jgi:hypothetical protein
MKCPLHCLFQRGKRSVAFNSANGDFGVAYKNWLIVIPATFESVRTCSHICLEKSSFRLDLAIKQTTPQPPYITQSFTNMHRTPAYTAGFLFAYSGGTFICMRLPMNNAAAV